MSMTQLTEEPAMIPTVRLDDERRWRAVLARDGSQDSAFVYGVRSTGIYCRPSCPSRRPRRDRVRFFARADEAQRAGFRPCRRCRPNEAAALDPRLATMRKACRLIDEAEGVVTLAQLGAALGVSPHHLQRSFTRVMGISPRAYAEARRLARVKRLLKSGDQVAGALYEAGYGSSSRLYERAASQLGMTPASYKRGGQGAEIAYATAASPLGRLLVASTAKGICMVSLGARDAELVSELERDFPHASIRRDGKALKSALEALARHLAGSKPHLDLPLDLRATAFQWRVWQALRAIPYGERRSYGEIAAAIGEPKAARAVGHACGSNPVSLIVPCHRAVGSNGALTGYRWGIARKKALLAREEAAATRATGARETRRRA
jgi:AraC family transcriptional regulator of adaptative response/methylated-DNA-[protein]-cysteine methyltransferase